MHLRDKCGRNEYRHCYELLFFVWGGGGMWRRQLFGRYSISCLFQNVEDSFEQLFLGVYGPNDDQEQMDL